MVRARAVSLRGGRVRQAAPITLPSDSYTHTQQHLFAQRVHAMVSKRHLPITHSARLLLVADPSGKLKPHEVCSMLCNG